MQKQNLKFSAKTRKFPLDFEIIDDTCFIGLNDTTIQVHIPTYKKLSKKLGEKN